jgi:hypothetical protein
MTVPTSMAVVVGYVFLTAMAEATSFDIHLATYEVYLYILPFIILLLLNQSTAAFPIHPISTCQLLREYANGRQC